MNWKIIFQLSIFGLIMAFGTVSLIPQHIEWVFWLAIFAFCAYVIAKICPGNFFLHGFFVSMVNCIWIVAVHVAFVRSYTMAHPDAAAMSSKLPLGLAIHPRLAMVVMRPIFGIMFGIILGLFSFVASKIVKKKAVA